MANGISRRRFVKSVAGGLAAAGLAGGASIRQLQGQAADAGLNILFLMTDQHHAGVLGCYGNEIVQTPNLDRLAREGVMFNNAVCATPFCTPTRASFLTGLWPHQHGWTHNIQGKDSGLTDDDTLAENMLFDRGVKTGHRGKWHLGRYEDLRCYRDDKPEGQGAGMLLEQHCPGADWPQEEGQPRYHFRPVVMRDFMLEAHRTWNSYDKIPQQDLSIIGRSVIPREAQPEAWFTNQILALMDKYAADPFMLTWSVSPPHAFWVCPDPYYSMYDPEQFELPGNIGEEPRIYNESVGGRLAGLIGERGIREYLRCYYGQVTMMDWYVGQLLDKLDDLGIADRTLVVFTSDHGDMNGGHGFVTKSVPCMYEEVARVPMIARLPGEIPAGRTTDVHMNSVDMMPTLLDYAGCEPPEGIAGESMRPFISGKRDDGRPGFSERTGLNYNWIQRMIRKRGWKYVFSSAWPSELFNLRNDPGEVDNLYAGKKTRKRRDALHAELREWMVATGDRGVERMPETPPEEQAQ